MDDLRSKIRAAFEMEQAPHPPAVNLRSSIVQNVTSQPLREGSLHWLAVAAAVVFAILVVGGLMSTRLAHRANVPMHPQPKATPVADYGPPPEGVSLIYAQDPNHPGWLIGFDWNGHPRGTVKLAQRLDNSVVLWQSPDGSAFAVTQGGKGGTTGDFLDRLGNLVAGVPASASVSGIWADDSRHLCVAFGSPQNSSSSWIFGTQLPGQVTRSVATITLGRTGTDNSISVASCSYANDQAVLVRTTSSGPSELWVVRISDGEVVTHRSISGGDQMANAVASRDGSLAAENSAKSTALLMGAAAPYTTIRRVSDDSLVLNLDPAYGVLAFNKDNSVALVTTSPWASGVPTHLALINLQTGATIWRSDGRDEFGGVLVQPDGSGLALFLQNPSDSTMHPALSLVIVRADGTTTTVQGTYIRP